MSFSPGLQRTILLSPSPTYQQVLQLLSVGLTHKEIGEKLRLNGDTIKVRMSEFYKEIGASNGCHAIAIAFRRGWIK